MRRCLLIPCFLFACFAGAPAFAAVDAALPEAHFPQLAKAIRNASGQSPHRRLAEIELELAYEARREAASVLWPTVAGFARLHHARDDRADIAATVATNKAFYDLTLTQPLFHWGALRSRVRTADLQLETAKARVQAGYAQTVHELRQSFLQMILKKAQLARQRLTLQTAESNWRQVLERIESGAAPANDASTLELAFLQAELDLERLETDFASARGAFAKAAGIPVPSEAEVPEHMPEVQHDKTAVQQLLARFLELPTEEAAELRTLQASIEAERNTRKIEKARLRPKFDAVLGITQDEHRYSIQDAERYQVNSTFVGLQVKWTLFDGFAANSAIRQSLARQRRTELQLKQASDSLRDAARAKARALDFVARHLQVIERRLEAAAAAKATREAEALAGARSTMDLAAADQALSDARLAAWSARVEYYSSLSEFLVFVGADSRNLEFAAP